jgi:hypothetical protein
LPLNQHFFGDATLHFKHLNWLHLGPGRQTADAVKRFGTQAVGVFRVQGIAETRTALIGPGIIEKYARK